MSKAGIQSNRGDAYQTLVAFDWAISMLCQPSYEWIEIDSINCQVDDVVIGKDDGTKICCQCKKNHPNHKSWTISDLSSELKKAYEQLKDQTATVKFYSCDPFGEIQALKEYSANFDNQTTFKRDMPSRHQTTCEQLSTLFNDVNSLFSPYEFIRRMEFEVSPSVERLQSALRERLRMIVNTPDTAFSILWAKLDFLGARYSGMPLGNVAVPHRMTKLDMVLLLQNAGALLTPPVDVVAARQSFKSTSSIGRGWPQTIEGKTLPIPILDDLLQAIDAKAKTILITGRPGTGKTCVLLALQDVLERRAIEKADLLPLFIQSSEFADLETAADRIEQGLPDNWVETIARLADQLHVVVVLDSLDVLSMARSHNSLKYFLSQVDRISMIENVTVVTACREFDRQFDHRISSRKWSHEFECSPLDWGRDVKPFLETLGMTTSSISAHTQNLICNFRELVMFCALKNSGCPTNDVNSQALADYYLDLLVSRNPLLGEVARDALEAMAAQMLRSRSLSIPRQTFKSSDPIQRGLISCGVLVAQRGDRLAFAHQTLLDVLVVNGSLKSDTTLSQFIGELPQVPFIRPSIRSYIEQLALGSRDELRKQVLTVLVGKHAFHIRRLVAHTFAETLPDQNDWPLLRGLRRDHSEIFELIYSAADRLEWHHFWMKFLVPHLKESRDGNALLKHAHHVGQWIDKDPAGIQLFWAELLEPTFVDKTSIAWRITRTISTVPTEHLNVFSDLILKLLDFSISKHSGFGTTLKRCIDARTIDESALWQYITSGIGQDDNLRLNVSSELRCGVHEFGHGSENFLSEQMQRSTVLLDLAIDAIECWSLEASNTGRVVRQEVRDIFLDETSFRKSHTQTSFLVQESIHVLMDAVEAAIKHNIGIDSDWWHNRKRQLSIYKESAIRYFLILACSESHLMNLDIAADFLSDPRLLRSRLSYELGTLMQATFIHFDQATQDIVQKTILDLHSEDVIGGGSSTWQREKKCNFLVTIPTYLRTEKTLELITEQEKLTFPFGRT
jgi:ATPase family associated with various cellular activities (AAA)